MCVNIERGRERAKEDEIKKRNRKMIQWEWQIRLQWHSYITLSSATILGKRSQFDVWSQFHQHFTHEFIVQKLVQSRTLSREKLLKNFCTKNALVKCAHKILMKLTPILLCWKIMNPNCNKALSYKKVKCWQNWHL